MKHQLFNGDCLKVLATLDPVDCIFADPPDNIGLGYDAYDDKLAVDAYRKLLHDWTVAFMRKAPVVWISFNAKWTFALGRIIDDLLAINPDWDAKPAVQVFTFGQHNKNDLGNNHRPLWRLKHKDAPLYPDAIKVKSWRERNGDKRAKPGGRVPGDVFDMQTEFHAGDVFDFPRVTGNSKQRCDWHPTQLHEELVERALRLTTAVGAHVLDPFGGTGTTLRVCERIGRQCTLIELDPKYCQHIRGNHASLTFKKIAA